MDLQENVAPEGQVCNNDFNPDVLDAAAAAPPGGASPTLEQLIAHMGRMQAHMGHMQEQINCLQARLSLFESNASQRVPSQLPLSPAPAVPVAPKRSVSRICSYPGCYSEGMKRCAKRTEIVGSKRCNALICEAHANWGKDGKESILVCHYHSFEHRDCAIM